MLIAELVRWGEEELLRAGVDNGKMEALWILGAQLSVKPLPLRLDQREVPRELDVQRFKEQIGKRSQRIPLAYVLGSQEFMGLDFTVTPDVLVPRQETEVLVEEIIKRYSSSDDISILDVGTGSGNIVISLAMKMGQAKYTATDCSSKALAVARKNAERFQAAPKITFLNGSLFSVFPGLDSFDLIVSNPPYIRTKELGTLEREIGFEPRSALDGGESGTEVLAPLIKGSRKYLKDGGSLFLEVGYDQSDGVKQMMEDAGFEQIESVKDLSGIDRVVIGKIRRNDG